MQPVEGAVIAAAGLGSRLGLGLPKCMLEIGGMTILSRLAHTLGEQVGRIHVVVGYREELVIELCARLHRDLVIVRNPEYRSTNTATSMDLGARGLRGKIAFMDGDLVVSQASMKGFIEQAAAVPVLIGVTKAKSDQAVFVRTEQRNGQTMVTGFTRDDPQPLEWANIVAGPANLMANTPGFVFDTLATLLPLPAAELELYEVDTPEDLSRAEQYIGGSTA